MRAPVVFCRAGRAQASMGRREVATRVLPQVPAPGCKPLLKRDAKPPAETRNQPHTPPHNMH